MTTLSISLITGLICLITFGIANGLVKIPSEKIGSQHFMVFKGFFVSLYLVLALAFTYKSQTFILEQFWFSIALAFLAFAAMSLFYRAMQIGKVGIISPLASTTLIFALVPSILFLEVKTTTAQIIAIIAILAGVILVKIDLKDIKNTFKNYHNDGFSIIILHTILMGTFMFLSQIPNKALGFVLFPLILESIQGLIAFGYLKLKKEKLIVPDRKTLGLIALITFFLTVGIIALFVGLKYGNPVIVFPLYYASPLIITMMGAYLYQERLQRHQYGAVLAIVLGIILLKIFS